VTRYLIRRKGKTSLMTPDAGAVVDGCAEGCAKGCGTTFGIVFGFLLAVLIARLLRNYGVFEWLLASLAGA
jgi:hypothetical protein